MGKKYKIVFHRNNCIGASACEAAFPEAWKVETDTGLATLQVSGATKTEQKEEAVIDEKDFEKHLEAAQVCPVHVIEIYDLETKEKVYPK